MHLPACALLGLSFLALIPGRTRAEGFALPAEGKQLLVVVSEGWKSSSASLQRWRREGHRWTRVGDAIPVVVGHAGLGWGAGLDDAHGRGASDPLKREGDRRAPAGVFALEEAFGSDLQPDGVRLPYRVTADELLCIDDPEAQAYNRVTSRKDAGTYATAEQMHRNDGLYALGIIVRHNFDPIRPGAGSCIFMHVWSKPGKATIGCTAMQKKDLAALLTWLDPAEHPLLVQLPRAVYAARRASWRLP